MESTELSNAIAAISLHRLAYNGNTKFSYEAENYKALAIKGLLQNAGKVYSRQRSEQNTLTAMAVTVLFVYDDMITVQNYLPTLIHIMHGFLKTVDPSKFKELTLCGFLLEQLGL